MSRAAPNPFAQAGRPATFAADPRKRAMIGKIKVAQKQLHMIDDDYRALLLSVTGEGSSKDCSLGQLEAMIKALQSKGFKPLPPKSHTKSGGTRAAANHPPARKARALWISLHQLGVVHNASEAALEAFACKQMKIEAFAWADQGKCYKLIEALKAMAERAGWSQDTRMARDGSSAVRLLKMNLAQALLVKLNAAGLVPQGWTLGVAAWRLLGLSLEGSPMFWDVQTFDAIASGFAEKLKNPMKPLSSEDFH